MRLNRTALVVFTGDPRREERGKHLPRHFLRTIHEHLAGVLRGVPDSDLIIASTPRGRFRLTGPDATIDRPAASLAEQIDYALATCFDHGYDRVLLLAGDIIDLTFEVLDDAITTLSADHTVAVVGPSSDGGFYLAGFNRLPRLDWRSIISEPSRSFQGLLSQLRASQTPFIVARPVDDIDSRSDAIRVLSNAVRSVSARLRTALLGLILASRTGLGPTLSAGRVPPPARRLRAPPFVAF